MNYKNTENFQHGATGKIGVLLTNLGTPDEPTPGAVRKYLAEFLSDPRVVEMPRWLWKIILHGIILRIRPGRAAKSYQSVWTSQGSPLLTISKQQLTAVQTALGKTWQDRVVVELAMRYGNPSIEDALNRLLHQGITRLLVLPLYPQYSATTTGSTFDAISNQLTRTRWLPDFRMNMQYHDHPLYIQSLANSIRKHQQQHGKSDRLLFSFHGLPKRYLTAGDPYHCQCHKTARLVAETLELNEKQWAVGFQSRFGREEWLKPYTDHLLKEWPSTGIKNIQVICPGFSADCLETLEEIAVENRDYFLKVGGEKYQYIPALNDTAEHIELLSELVRMNIQGWPEASDSWSNDIAQSEAAKSARLAKTLGGN